MNMPLPNSNVAHFGNRREEPEHSETMAAPAAAAMPASATPTPGRTITRRLPALLKSLARHFKGDQEGVLYIDHAEENIRNSFMGISEFEGKVSMRHGLIISENMNAPKGTIKVDGTVIIDEGAEVNVNLECKTLIILGSLEGNIKATGLLLNYGSISGDIQYGSLEAAGKIRGSFNPIEA